MDVDSDSDIELLSAPVAARPSKKDITAAPSQFPDLATATLTSDGISRRATSQRGYFGDGPASARIVDERPKTAVPRSEVIEIDDGSDNEGNTTTKHATGTFGQASTSRHMYAYNSYNNPTRSSSAPVPRFADDMDLSDDDDLPEIGAPSTRTLGRSQSDNLPLRSTTTGYSYANKGKGRATERPSSPPLYSRGGITHEPLAEASEPEYDLPPPITRHYGSDDDEPEKKTKKRKLPAASGSAETSTGDKAMSATERKKLEAQQRKAVKDAEKAEKAAKLAADKEAKSIMRGSNKLLSRAQTPKELIVDISTALMTDPTFKSKVYTDFDARLNLLECTHTQPGEERPARSGCFERIVTWRRKVNKDYDSEKRYWRPREAGKATIEQEKTVLLYLNVFDMEDAILAKTSGEKGKTLVELASAARTAYGNDFQVFLLVQGLSEKTKAKASAANAEWTAGDKDKDGAPAAKSKSKSTKRIFNNKVSVDAIEQELIRVQVALHRCFVIRAETPGSAVDWLVELTKDISFRPYKLIERAREVFLNIDGKIATKGGLKDTYRNQLECIHGVTASMASAIAKEYPSWKCLLTAYKQCKNLSEQHALLQDLHVSNRTDGAATSRPIGKAISEKIYLVLFTPDKDLDISGNMKDVRARVAK